MYQHECFSDCICGSNSVIPENIKGAGMKQKIRDKHKILAALLLLLVLSLAVDITQESVIQEGAIQREEIGGEEKEIQLQVDIEGVIENYDYTIEIPPAQPTKEEAEIYFEKAIAEMQEDFQKIEGRIPMQGSYVGDVVEADWSFAPFGLIDTEGNIRYEKLNPEGEIVQAEVHLFCGEYEKIFTFPFQLFPKELSSEEESIKLLEESLQEQMALEGSSWLQLPTKLGDNTVIWDEKREYITPQILFLELVTLVLLWVVSKRKRIQDEQKKIADMEKDYPDIVSQLSLLLGAGMTTRQAWNRMTAQYVFKRKAGMIGENMVYEAISRINRRLMEGESERGVYQQFSQEIPAPCYHKLMRILLGSLEKGTQGICNRLEEESQLAYEQRIAQAKKRGEEASTKMLLPLMLMLMIVMGIVMLPALIEFQI